MISFEKIKQSSLFFEHNKLDLGNFLPEHQIYLAHLPPQIGNNLEEETLEEHLSLVADIFVELVQKHHLETVIDGIISRLVNKIENNTELCDYIKLLFFHVVIYHDFGKVNHLFQFEKMKNFNSSLKKIKHEFKHYHSGLGAYLFVIHHLYDNPFQGENQNVVDLITCFLSYPIVKHHGARLISPFEITTYQEHSHKYIEYLPFFNKILQDNDLIHYFQEDFMSKTSEKLNYLYESQKDNANDGLDKKLDGFALYSLIRLSFSLLTASDYLATAKYMSNGRLIINDLGTLNLERINSLFEFVSISDLLKNGKKNYNKATYEQLESGYILQNPKGQSNDSLNLLRQEMALEVIKNIRANSYKNLFYIEAPTGGGKTNLSMLATVELLKANEGKVNKVFYVFPFTTLITQTFTAIKETLNLSEDEVVELHSKAGYKQKENEKYGVPAPEKYIDTKQLEELQDGVYSDEKENYIDNLFVNYPFCLLSHVKFFDLLKTNEKEANYLLHRLANSVVVIDELQSYDPAHWDKILYFIAQYSKLYNIKFILMSATLPKLGKLQVLEEEYVSNFVYLLPDAKNNYFLNPNFSERVTFNFDLFERKDLELPEIAETLLVKSKEYAAFDFGKAKPKDSVYCIIEFIFKKSATEFYNEIAKINKGFFDEILVLSGTILEHRRKEIINLLKNPIARNKRVLLITTQVVEAGVDIDMDLGFKDRSMIDSEEQLAGRINRNVNKKNCTLYLFNYNKEHIIYGQDLRYKETKNLKISDYQRILRTKDFDFLYNSVFTKIDYWAKSDKISNQNHDGQLKHYRTKIEKLQFETVHQKFKLIDQENMSCFIPLKIPIEVEGVSEGMKDAIFSKNELQFLKENHVFVTEDFCINGSEVFDLYLSFIQNKRDFIQQKIGMKTLQGIMARFVFSIFASKNVELQIIHFSDEVKSEYGYKYIEFWQDFYDISFGMSDTNFNSNETQFL